MRTSRAKVRVEDGLAYLDLVKSKFETQRPHAYNTFLEIMSDFKEKRIDTAGVVSRVVELFCDSELILKFNAFLPAGYTIEEADGYQLAFPSGVRRKILPCADGRSGLRPRSAGGSVSSGGSLPRVRRRTPLGADTHDSPGVLLTWYSGSRRPLGAGPGADPFLGESPSILGGRRQRRRPPAATTAGAERKRTRISDDGDADADDSPPDSGKRVRIACRRSSPRKGAAAVH